MATNRTFKSPMFVLKITDGIDKGKKWNIDQDREYLVGRSLECDIILDANNKRASRKHASLYLKKNSLTVKNLSQSNPAMINNKPIVTMALGKGDKLTLGASVFVMMKNNNDVKQMKNSKRPIKKVLLGLAFLVVVLNIFLFFFKQNSSVAQKENLTSALPGINEETSLSREKKMKNEDLLLQQKPLEQKENKASAYYRRGQFFYNAGKIRHAIDSWEQALLINPEDISSKKWLLRAEVELTQMIGKYYQQAMINKKFMRNAEALNFFRIVVHLSQDKSTEIYRNSVEQIALLEGK